MNDMKIQIKRNLIIELNFSGRPDQDLWDAGWDVSLWKRIGRLFILRHEGMRFQMGGGQIGPCSTRQFIGFDE